jgi:hypothetical protein
MGGSQLRSGRHSCGAAARSAIVAFAIGFTSRFTALPIFRRARSRSYYDWSACQSSGSAPALTLPAHELILAKDLQRTLIDFGYDAFAIASSAAAAEKRADERRPDLVMMDIRIKGPHDGIQTAIVLKQKFPPRSST